MAEFVDSTVKEIDSRLRELKEEVSKLEAARAAHDAASIGEVSAWVRTTGLVDAHIAKLLKGQVAEGLK